jgi:hypothetical protein
MMKQIIGLLIIAFFIAGCKKGGGSGSNSTPGAASLLTPLKDQACTTGTVISDTESDVSFTWGAGQNATSYDVSIKNLLTQAIITKQVQGTQVTATLLRNTPYSWYVTSKTSKSSTKTDVWKFYNAGAGIVTYAPFPAEIVAPVLGQIVTTSAGKINLSWKGSATSGTIVGYNVYFGPSSSPDLFKTMMTDNFINNVTVSANTTYYWHVVTVDSNGNVADSGLYNFFVNK